MFLLAAVNASIVFTGILLYIWRLQYVYGLGAHGAHKY